MTSDRNWHWLRKLAQLWRQVEALARQSDLTRKEAILLAAILSAAVAMAVVAVAVMWRQVGNVSMTLTGYIALSFGVIASLGVGMGLMGLIFYSSRHGYDDGVGQRAKDVTKPPR